VRLKGRGNYRGRYPSNQLRPEIEELLGRKARFRTYQITQNTRVTLSGERGYGSVSAAQFGSTYTGSWGNTSGLPGSPP